MTTLKGFCPREMRNVPIGPDRKCLTDGAFALPPSTACAHRRLNQDGTWSNCDQDRPCKPVAPDAWRAILGQQDKALVKRERDRAAARVAAGLSARTTPGPKSPRPRLTSRKLRRCSRCVSMFKIPLGTPDEPLCYACRTAPRPLVACGRCDRPRVCRPNGLCEYCDRTIKNRTVKTWHPRHVSCCDCHGTERPYYDLGRCRPCFDAWDEARQYRAAS